MGNSYKKTIRTPDIRLEEWQVEWEAYSSQEPRDIFQPAHNIFRTLKHSDTNELVDEYKLYWRTQEDYLCYLNAYNWRHREPYIVNSRYIKEEHSKEFCSSSYEARVYIQHIWTRLSKFKDIPCPQNLYVMLATLEGYQKLSEHLQYFKVQEDQICIDTNFNVKVWINSDLSKNYPQTRDYDSKDKDESEMVAEIIDIVMENTDQQSEPSQGFRAYYYSRSGKKTIRFQQAKLLINDFARKHHLEIPDRIEAIRHLLVEANNSVSHNSTSDQGYENQPQDHELANMNEKYQQGYPDAVAAWKDNQGNISLTSPYHHQPNYSIPQRIQINPNLPDPRYVNTGQTKHLGHTPSWQTPQFSKGSIGFQPASDAQTYFGPYYPQVGPLVHPPNYINSGQYRVQPGARPVLKDINRQNMENMRLFSFNQQKDNDIYRQIRQQTPSGQPQKDHRQEDSYEQVYTPTADRNQQIGQIEEKNKRSIDQTARFNNQAGINGGNFRNNRQKDHMQAENNERKILKYYNAYETFEIDQELIADIKKYQL